MLAGQGDQAQAVGVTGQDRVRALVAGQCHQLCARPRRKEHRVARSALCIGGAQDQVGGLHLCRCHLAQVLRRNLRQVGQQKHHGSLGRQADQPGAQAGGHARACIGDGQPGYGQARQGGIAVRAVGGQGDGDRQAGLHRPRGAG